MRKKKVNETICYSCKYPPAFNIAIELLTRISERELQSTGLLLEIDEFLKKVEKDGPKQD